MIFTLNRLDASLSVAIKFKMEARCPRLLLLVVLLASPVFPFNLNAQYRRAVQTGRKSSAFGYSIAFYQEKNIVRLLVGAPLANGAFQCNLNGSIVCNEFKINSGLGSWLGATVASRNGNALVCSPRSGRYINGNCYHSKDLSLFSSVDANRFEYGNAGLSAAFSSDQILIGAPSVNYNRGHIFRVHYPKIRSIESIDLGTSYAFFAYALATGRISGPVEGVATSSVFRASALGEVHLRLLDSTSTPIRRIEGKQEGEFFGNDLVVTDVNGDGLDDLLVGAPHFSDYDDPELKFEIGKVYVYQQSKSQQFESNPTSVLVGRATGARFGHALAALGDVNDDKFNDVAVGAPYEDGGRVYVFFGSRSGLRSEPGQVIDGRSFGLRTFGFSLTGNVDVDGNGYKDLAVGAYQSDAIVYLPARPVIRMTTLSIAFIPDQISFDDSNFLCRNIKDAVCSTLSYCLSFDGLNVAQRVTFNVSIVLDVKQSRTSRLFFADDSSSLVEALTITKNRRVCHERQVHIKRDIIDKLSPIEAAMNIQVVGHEPSSLDLPPIFDLYASNSTSNSMSIANNCGPDNECIPDLQLTIALNDTRVVQGAKQFPTLRISVLNKGEDAFESHFNMFLPETLLFKSSSLKSCSTPVGDSEPSVQCDVGNPLETNGYVNFTISLEPIPDVADDRKTIEFQCDVVSKSNELSDTLADNKAAGTLNLAVNATLKVISPVVELRFNRTSFELNGNNEKTLPRFVQNYEIVKSGPSTILGAILTINFVTQSKDGLQLCSLEGKPRIIAGQGSCQTDQGQTALVVVQCQIRSFDYDKFAVSLDGRLAEDISKVNLKENVSISSEFSAVVTRLPFGLDPTQVAPTSGVAKLLVSEEVKPSLLNSQVEWWVYVVSAAGALLLLLIIALILYKLGFFKRNRPPANEAVELQTRNHEQDQEDDGT